MRNLFSLTATLVLCAHLPAHSETYQSWAAVRFTPAQIAAGLAAPNQDPDGDLCPNIHEYAANCLPNDPDSRWIASVQTNESAGETTVSFPFAPDRTDIEYVVLVSPDLESWSPAAIFISNTPLVTYHLNGNAYVKIGIRPKPGVIVDSDTDGLSDHYEENLVATSPEDAFQHIGQILPQDDFDGDGTPNLHEADNQAAAPVFTVPAPITPDAISRAIELSASSPPAMLKIHTPLK